MPVRYDRGVQYLESKGYKVINGKLYGKKERKAHPKVVIGYSDTTALLLAIYAKIGLITFYGPAVASSFGELPPFVNWTLGYFHSMISEKMNCLYYFNKPTVWTDILFIEDSLKDACTIERSFSLLKLAGVFEKVGGIILGKHEKFDDNETGKRPY